MANSIFIKADELAKELDISQGLAYKMIAQWNEELRAKGYTTVGGRVSRRYYQEKIYGAEEAETRVCHQEECSGVGAGVPSSAGSRPDHDL